MGNPSDTPLSAIETVQPQKKHANSKGLLNLTAAIAAMASLATESAKAVDPVVAMTSMPDVPANTQTNTKVRSPEYTTILGLLTKNKEAIDKRMGRFVADKQQICNKIRSTPVTLDEGIAVMEVLKAIEGSKTGEIPADSVKGIKNDAILGRLSELTNAIETLKGDLQVAYRTFAASTYEVVKRKPFNQRTPVEQAEMAEIYADIFKPAIALAGQKFDKGNIIDVPAEKNKPNPLDLQAALDFDPTGEKPEDVASIAGVTGNSEVVESANTEIGNSENLIPNAVFDKKMTGWGLVNIDKRSVKGDDGTVELDFERGKTHYARLEQVIQLDPGDYAFSIPLIEQSAETKNTFVELVINGKSTRIKPVEGKYELKFSTTDTVEVKICLNVELGDKTRSGKIKYGTPVLIKK